MATTYSAIERNKKPAGALDIPEDFDLIQKYLINKGCNFIFYSPYIF